VVVSFPARCLTHSASGEAIRIGLSVRAALIEKGIHGHLPELSGIFFEALRCIGLKSNAAKYARSLLQENGGFVAIASNPA
jgi:hypothetical protein